MNKTPKNKELLIKSKIIRKKKNNNKNNINKESNERIREIMENDICANNNIVDDYNNEMQYSWEDDFFKKFEWLSDSLENGPDENDLTYNARYDLFLDCCKVLESESVDIPNEPELKLESEYNKLYMYFVSLADDKLFLHTDFKMEYDDVMKTCEECFEYAKQHIPRKIIFTLEINDLYDVDKYVKLFMHMFGIDDTRGGSYTDVVLPEYLKESIHHEKRITSIDYYLKKKIK